MEWPQELGSEGWRLVNAEDRHRESPDTFWIPPREERESLERGQGAKVLFLLADRSGDELISFVERMWLVVTGRDHDAYRGILDSTPVSSHAVVKRGSIVRFAPEHVCDLDAGPPKERFDDLLRLAKRITT